MAEDLKRSAEICTFDLLVLHENDGLFIKYSDGTSLELSSCGSAFLHREAPPSNSTMRQFTRFALSSFKTKITEAVRFRNLFAARPYLCKELTDLQELKVRCSSHCETNTWSHLGLSVYQHWSEKISPQHIPFIWHYYSLQTFPRMLAGLMRYSMFSGYYYYYYFFLSFYFLLP